MLPEIVTAVPPAVGPLFGEMPEMVGAVAGATISEKLAEVETAFASCTWAVKEKLPDSVAVPVIVPVAAFKPKPDGSAPPVMLHVYGGVPPVAASVAA